MAAKGVNPVEAVCAHAGVGNRGIKSNIEIDQRENLRFKARLSGVTFVLYQQEGGDLPLLCRIVHLQRWLVKTLA
jgi:hypothetical protein